MEGELYDKHIDFASNPLLLTMMYITFIDNNMIPEHLTDFMKVPMMLYIKGMMLTKRDYLTANINVRKLENANSKIYLHIFVFNHIFRNSMNLVRRKFVYTSKGE